MPNSAEAKPDDVRRKRDQLRRVPGNAAHVGCPAILDAHVAADGPAKLLQSLQERADAGLRFRIVRRQVHEHANAPHMAALLRACRKRPCCRAAERG